MKRLLAAALALALPGAALAADPEYAVIRMSQPVDRPAAEVWKKVDGLQLILQGDERRPEPARTLRREAAALLLDLARSLEVKDAAPMLWKVALFEVDPEHNLGMTHLQTAPWFLRTEARVPFRGWHMLTFTAYNSVLERVNGILALEIMGFAILLALTFYLLSRRAWSQTLTSRRESAELRQLNARLPDLPLP